MPEQALTSFTCSPESGI